MLVRGWFGLLRNIFTRMEINKNFSVAERARRFEILLARTKT